MIIRKDIEKQIFVVSYPRSGNTWMRFLLVAMLYPDEETSFPNASRLAPDLHQKEGWMKQKVIDPLILKCHLQEYPAYFLSKNIYIYRDPRDIAVSFYHFYDWEKKLRFNDYLPKFVNGDIHKWTPWACHLYYWLIEDNKLDFIFVKYEDLLINPEENLKRVMKYLSIKKVDSSDRAIEEAVKRCEYKHLVRRAEIDGLRRNFLGIRAKAGYWKEYFNQDMLDFLWKRFGSVMERVGYEKGRIDK